MRFGLLKKRQKHFIGKLKKLYRYQELKSKKEYIFMIGFKQALMAI